MRLVSTLLLVALGSAFWGKTGTHPKPVIGLKGGVGSESSGWTAKGRFGELKISADGSYTYTLTVSESYVRPFGGRPGTLVDTFHAVTKDGDERIRLDAATIPIPGASKTNTSAGPTGAGVSTLGTKPVTKLDPLATTTDPNGAVTGATTVTTQKPDTVVTSSKPVAIAGSVPLVDGTYRRGDTGSGVEAVQQNLKTLGYSIGPDGDFGPKTEKIVKQFQTDKGLSPTGVVDAATMAALKTATGQGGGAVINNGAATNAVVNTNVVDPSTSTTVKPSVVDTSVASGATAVVDTSTVATNEFPRWMTIAEQELRKGVKEFEPGSNPIIENYHKAARYWVLDDKEPWCGSFLAYVFSNSGYDLPKDAFRSIEWKNKWASSKKVAEPVYGAVGWKSRAGGGGHVSIVVGTVPGTNDLAMLGGNQDDSVNVARYPRDVWVAWMVPSSYNAPATSDLKPYLGEIANNGSES